MFTLHNIDFIRDLITKLLAYALVITPAGAFHAWTNKKMGDSTASDEGYTQLNPLLHVDLFGLFAIMMLGLGWIKSIPFNPQNIIGKLRIPRLVVATFSGLFFYLLQALLYLISISFFPKQLGTSSSLLVVVGNILIYAAGISLGLAVLELIFSGIKLVIHLVSEKNYYPPQHLVLTLVLAPILILFTFGTTLYALFAAGLLHIEHIISKLIGLM